MRRWHWTALTLTLLLAACGGGGGEETTASEVVGPSGMVGASGGTVSSEDGQLRLEIPPGALGEDTMIEVVEIAEEDLGGDASALSGPVFDLLPDGQTFAAPITVVRTFDASPHGLNDGEVPFLIIIHERPEAWELLDSTTTRVGDVVEVSAEITHFTGNAVIDAQVLQPFGDEVRLVMFPDAFEAEKGLGELVFLSTDVPSLINRGVIDVIITWRLGEILIGTPGETGGLVLCDGVGNDYYTASLELKMNQWNSINVINRLTWVFGGAQFQEVKLRVEGKATCTAPAGDAAGDDESVSDTGLAGVESLAGDLFFDSRTDDLTYTDPFTLEYVPPDAEGLPDYADLWRDFVEGFLAELPDPPILILDSPVVLSQIRPGLDDQESYGVAANMADGSQLVITGGLGEGHLEVYILDLMPRPGFPESSQQIEVDGFNLGLSPEEELLDAIRLAYALLFPGDAPPPFTGSSLWEFDIEGEFGEDLLPELGDEPIAIDPDSEIAFIGSGLFEGERWIKLDLSTPIPDSSEQFTKQYNLFIRSDQDDLFGASWTILQGIEPFASSFCLADGPNCPSDGIVPVLGVPGDTLEDITFFFPGDAFSDATGLEFSASVLTGLTEEPEDLIVEEFRDGARFPWIEIEMDPC